jgi:hypothetical protein
MKIFIFVQKCNLVKVIVKILGILKYLLLCKYLKLSKFIKDHLVLKELFFKYIQKRFHQVIIVKYIILFFQQLIIIQIAFIKIFGILHSLLKLTYVNLLRIF